MPGRADADVVLLGVLLLEAEARRRRRDERPAHAHALRRRVLRPSLRTLDEPHDLVVLEVAGRRDDDVAADVHRTVVRGERATADARDHVARADHRPPERLVAEDGLREEIVDELLRRVLVHGDLLEDDLALRVELRERRREDHVGHDVDRRVEVRVRHARVDHRVLARRCGVQLAAEPVERLGDLLRGVRRRALEEQVLDEMRDARALVLLVARTGADPVAERDGADARHALGDHALAGIELGDLVLLHRSIVGEPRTPVSDPPYR